jgi:hypothetical protein
MADRYWVGGTADWNATAGTKWATTDGGAGGASVPTSADNVFFTAASGAVTVTITISANSLNFNCTGFTGTISCPTTNLSVYGNFTLSSGMTWSVVQVLYFPAASGSFSITTAGKTLASNVYFGYVSNSTATWTLQDAYTGSAYIILDSGTFASNNFSITALGIQSNYSNVRTINLGSSTVTLTGGTNSFIFTTTTNLTFNAGTSTINFSGASPTLSCGSGLTLNNVSLTNAGAGTRVIVGSNTFNTFTVSGTTPTIRFSSGATNTFTNFNVSGTVGVLKIIDSSTAGSPSTLSKASGTVTSNYVSIKDSTATGGAVWTATNSTNAGGNSGWIFSSSSNGNFFFIM